MPHSPVAVSRLGADETSREPQNIRAVRWLLDQPGGRVVVVTPQRDFSSASLDRWQTISAVRARARRVVAGEIVPSARGIWTNEVRRAPEEVVGPHLQDIVEPIYPGVVVRDASEFTLRPTNGQLFVSHPSRATLNHVRRRAVTRLGNT